MKFRLAEVVEENGTVATRPALLEGAVKGIGGATSLDVGGQQLSRSTVEVEARDHTQAMRVLMSRLGDSLGSIEAVGHRVVHGGDRYVESTMITEQVEAGIDALSELAPFTIRPVLREFGGEERSWDPPSRWWLSSIRRFTERCLKSPGTTRFQPISPIAITSADTDFTGLRMRRSPTVTRSALETSLKQARIITLQLGNGCSVAAIDRG